jgi:hypothetical protein
LFGYQGSDQEVILAQPVVDSREIKILLLRFTAGKPSALPQGQHNEFAYTHWFGNQMLYQDVT